MDELAVDVESRIAALEKAVSTWQKIGGIAAISLLLIVGMGQGSWEGPNHTPGIINATTIKAHRFEVVDGSGVVKGNFTINGVDPIVQLFDRQGKPAIILWVDDGSPHILLKKSDSPVAWVGHSKELNCGSITTLQNGMDSTLLTSGAGGNGIVKVRVGNTMKQLEN